MATVSAKSSETRLRLRAEGAQAAYDAEIRVAFRTLRDAWGGSDLPPDVTLAIDAVRIAEGMWQRALLDLAAAA